jgi:hypothetical protein
MVHTWISLRNNKIYKKSLNYKIVNIFKNSDSFFYGDYDLDIYIGVKQDYPNLESVTNKVINKSDGWIGNCDTIFNYKNYDIQQIISFFGIIDDKSFRKMFPRKEKFNTIKTIELRNDGNFKFISSETDKFFYVFCFATS